MRRAFWILVTPLIGATLFWLFTSRILEPRLEAWALAKIQNYSHPDMPLKIQAESLRIRFFKPSISLERIRILPEGELSQIIPSVEVGSVRVFVDFFQLLGGRFLLSAVVVESPEIEIFIDPLLESDSPPKALPIDAIFAQTELLPLQRLVLQNLQIKLSSKKLKLDGTIQSGDLLISNMGKSLTAKTSLPSLELQLADVGSFTGSLDSHLFLNRQSLRILQLGLRLNKSELLLRGEITPISQAPLRPAGVLSLTSKIDLSQLYDELQRFRPDLHLPNFSGELNLEAETRFDGRKNIKGKADLKTTQVEVDSFTLGDAQIKGEFSEEDIQLSEIKIAHPAGNAIITKTKVSLNDPYKFKTRISLPTLDMQKLFHSLDLKNIPVGMALKGDVPCEGQILPEIQVDCSSVTLAAEKIWVKSDNNARGTAILDLDSMEAQGRFSLTAQAIGYSADLKLGQSLGSSEGTIDFDDGFKIAFKTNKLQFEDVKNLANLKLQGATALEGSTSGNSDFAVFSMDLQTKDFIFEDFTLGDVATKLSFKKSVMNFDAISGVINKTNYQGQLRLDLNADADQEALSGNFTVPSAELADLAQVFTHVYRPPLEVSGQGAVKVKVAGPLNFWKMNYHLESAFKDVLVGPESFDRLVFNVKAENGNIATEKVFLSKGESVLEMKGGISAEQVLNLNADAKNWNLEQLDSIGRINNSITGKLNFSAEFKNPVSQPQITMKGNIADTRFEEQEIPNSNFIFKIDRDTFGAQLSLFGNRVQSEFRLPFEKGKAPLDIKVTTNDWNFSALLGLIGGANLAAEYNSSLTSNINLRSESGEFFKASGSMTIDDFSLKRGDLSFKNQGSIEVTSRNGNLTIKNFDLAGPKSILQVRGENFDAQDLSLAVNLQTDMRLLQIFTPFLEDLGGTVQLSTKISGSLKKPQILGNLNTQNAFLKLKGFPHPFERLSLEVVFSQSKVLINSIRGNIAGGTLVGDGGILINGIKDLPTSVRLRLEGVTFNVPDRVRSTGQADLIFSGNWFPFTLSGSFLVASALIDKEFTEEDGSPAGVKQSFYLPKVIKEARFEPLLLDLQLVLEKNIIVKNSLIDGSVAGNIKVKGPPGNPILVGRITTDRKTQLIFKDKIFEIQNGLIDFNDPDEINPKIYINAQSRIDEYDVSLIAQGAAKSFSIRLSSVPPLPEQEIISLIALGVTSSALDQNVQSGRQAEQLGAEIGGAVLTKPINKQLESVTGFNLSVSSQYDSTRNISVPKITLSRRMSERVKVSGSRPVRDTQSYDLKLEYLINNNITAVGSFESRGVEDSSTFQQTQPASQSIFGLDLEFKREFK